MCGMTHSYAHCDSFSVVVSDEIFIIVLCIYTPHRYINVLKYFHTRILHKRMCVYIHIHVYSYAHTYPHLLTLMLHIRLNVYKHIHVTKYMFIIRYICSYSNVTLITPYVHKKSHKDTYTQRHTHSLTHTHTHTHTHKHTQHTCTCTCVQVLAL